LLFALWCGSDVVVDGVCVGVRVDSIIGVGVVGVVAE